MNSQWRSNSYKKRRQGSVLIAVLVLLTLFMFPVLAGLQSTLYQTRLTQGLASDRQLRAEAIHSLETAFVSAHYVAEDEALSFSPARIYEYEWGNSIQQHLIEQIATTSSPTQTIYLMLTAYASDNRGGEIFARALYERHVDNPLGEIRKLWWLR